MIRITRSQLFSLIVLYLLGSTTLFALGIGARRSAFIVVCLSLLIGLLLAWIYTTLQSKYPDANLVEILKRTFGKRLAIPVSVLYGLYFFYNGSLNFNEFGHIVKIAYLPDTPIVVIQIVFLFTAVYMIILGVEVVGRSTEMMLPMMILFLIITYAISIISGQFNLEELFPLFEEDVRTIVEETFNVVRFPFGELVLFLMLFHYLESKQSLKKTVLYAVLTAGVFLILNIITILAVLGPELAEKAAIPLVEVIVGINIADIIVNMDVLAVILLFISGFYKMLLNFFGAVLVFHYLFPKLDIKWVILFVGLSLYTFSTLNFPSITYQYWVGVELFLPYVHAWYQFIPILLLVLTYLKSKRKERF